MGLMILMVIFLPPQSMTSERVDLSLSMRIIWTIWSVSPEITCAGSYRHQKGIQPEVVMHDSTNNA
jgi:hypothetical protein